MKQTGAAFDSKLPDSGSSYQIELVLSYSKAGPEVSEPYRVCFLGPEIHLRVLADSYP